MNSKTDDKMSKNFHGICQKELLKINFLYSFHFRNPLPS